ncbi:MAG TPA: glycosyltransferase [Microlunatus sp.]
MPEAATTTRAGIPRGVRRRIAGPTADTTYAVLGAPQSGWVILMVIINLAASVWYFSWLLNPVRVGNPVLYGLLLAAEFFNVGQAVGFWWTLLHDRPRRSPAPAPHYATVDVFIPRYDEPVEIVEPVVAAAVRLRGADVTVHLLDDGDSPEMVALAERHGVHYIARTEHSGAKAGNINHALKITDGEYVVIFDCDHVPHPEFLRRTMGYFSDDELAFVQTPQYYANADRNPVAAAAWSQQALFFGCIARGKSRLGAMFCCGTNVIFRRSALDQVGGFPENSVTEDFELSLIMQERGWKTQYVPEVLVQGLGPEDIAAYSSQQMRWARGCLSAIGRTFRSRLPLRLKSQYLLSSLHFLTGWTVLIYMSLPVIKLLTGAQPVAASTANDFLLHFAPYFMLSIAAVALAGGGVYTFAAFALAASSFWIHIAATLQVVTRRKGRFVVTPKDGAGLWQPAAVWPGLLTCAVLLGVSIWGLTRSQDAATLNNVAFAGLHLVVLGTGMSWALRPRALERRSRRGLPIGESRWQSAVARPTEDDPDPLKELIPAS